MRLGNLSRTKSKPDCPNGPPTLMNKNPARCRRPDATVYNLARAAGTRLPDFRGLGAAIIAIVTTDTESIRQALEDAGVTGSHDFGRFVNDIDHFAPSTFDERAAMPVLISLLPVLSDVASVNATARHLGRPWARPAAFDPLYHAFLYWAPQNENLGWTIGDSLITTSTIKNLGTLLALSLDSQFGRSRQMIVNSLWRFKKDSRVADALITLIEDRDVSLQAMSALRRAVGNGEAIAHLIRVRDTSTDQIVRKQAQKSIVKCDAALAKAQRGHEHRGLGPVGS